MTITPSRFLLVAAVVCLAIATLIATGVVSGDATAWEDGGLLAFAASFLL